MIRTLLLVCILATGGSELEAHVPKSAAARSIASSDEHQIRAIFAQWERSWNAHDMHAFAQLFHEDATWVVWTGRVWKGRKAIEDGHVEAHRTFFRHSTQLSQPEEINQIAPDVVVARSRTTLKGDARDPEATIYGLKLLVITRRSGVWKILYGQNTRITPTVLQGR